MKEVGEDLAARFDLREERFKHGDFDVRVQLPFSSDALIDVSEFNTDERLPYWAELWPSARALARWIVDIGEIPGRALELGCGVGLPSLALRHRGVEVLATDYYGDAVRFAELNANRNGLGPLPTREVDWRSLPGDLGRFPLVIAADVLYESRNVHPLAEALDGCLEAGGEVLLADPGRIHFDTFVNEARDRGWTVEKVAERDEDGPGGAGKAIRVSIVRLAPPRS